MSDERHSTTRESTARMIGRPMHDRASRLAIMVAGAAVKLRLTADDKIVRSFMTGPRGLVALIERLREAGREAFGPAAVPAQDEGGAGAMLAPPGPRDDVYQPGAPWRRGRWLAPVPSLTPWERARNAERGA